LYPNHPGSREIPGAVHWSWWRSVPPFLQAPRGLAYLTYSISGFLRRPVRLLGPALTCVIGLGLRGFAGAQGSWPGLPLLLPAPKAKKPDLLAGLMPANSLRPETDLPRDTFAGVPSVAVPPTDQGSGGEFRRVGLVPPIFRCIRPGSCVVGALPSCGRAATSATFCYPLCRRSARVIYRAHAWRGPSALTTQICRVKPLGDDSVLSEGYGAASGCPR